ncbi:MAG: isocitrate/isopropylmalate dehydrogenase family protein [Mycobacteriaceae bacterium]
MDTAGMCIGLLIGDGIGAEIVPAAVQLAEAAMSAVGGEAVDWVPLPLGAKAIESHGCAVPEETLNALAELDAWILGPHDSASYPESHRGVLPPGGLIRKRFDLFANIRPVQSFTGIKALVPDMDLVLVRENSEGFYADRNMFVGSGEFMPTSEVALAVGVITRAATERIARAAYELARARASARAEGRPRVVVIHKRNVLPIAMGLFVDVCQEIAKDFPEVILSLEHVDAAAAHLVRRACDYDVLLTENMFGDILSDLAGELSGSLGVCASLNCSQTQAMAQAAHGSAPDIAGKNQANPTAMMLSVAMLYEWLAGKKHSPVFHTAAECMQRAVRSTIESGYSTIDLGGKLSTTDFTQRVIDWVASADKNC